MRRVWIVAKKGKISKKNIADATLNGCAEIAKGIPSALTGVVGALPCAYEEPEPPSSALPRDLEAELDALTADFGNLEARVGKSEDQKGR